MIKYISWLASDSLWRFKIDYYKRVSSLLVAGKRNLEACPEWHQIIIIFHELYKRWQWSQLYMYIYFFTHFSSPVNLTKSLIFINIFFDTHLTFALAHKRKKKDIDNDNEIQNLNIKRKSVLVNLLKCNLLIS